MEPMKEQSKTLDPKKKKRRKILIIVASVLVGSFLLFYVAGNLIATPFVYKAIFKSPDPFDPAISAGLVDYSNLESTYPREKFTFTSSEKRIQGYRYDNPSSEKIALVLPGIGSTADEYLAQDLYFYDHGYDVVTFDQYGVGQSEGDWLRGMAQEAIDLGNLLTYLSANEATKSQSVYLFGHSQGAYAACVALNDAYPSVKAVAAVSGFDSSEDTVIAFAKRYVGFLADISGPFVTGYQRQLFGGLSTRKAHDGINKTAIPFLIAQGDDDETIPSETIAIYHYRDRIVNDKVSYYVGTGLEGGHETIMYSLEADAYRKELKTQYQALLKEYDNKIPYEKEVAFYETIDDAKYSDLNKDLMSEVINTFDKA
jgi:pimeloyl-ACP methyl ester carboxylesterase